MPKRLLLLAVAAVFVAPGPLLGQEARAAPPAGAVDSVPGPRQALAALEAGQRLKVKLEEDRIHEGRFVGFDGDRITMDGEELRYLPLGELSVVWTRGRSAGTGALVGAGSGLVLGGIAGAFVASLGCSTAGVDCNVLEGVLAVGGIGAGAGAGLGALVGSLIPRWVQRWP